METALALYEALIQSNVSAPAARRVAEALEKDMTSSLATKQDTLLISRDVQHVRHELTALEGRIALMIQNSEHRTFIRLGGLMTVLVGLFGALVTLLR